MSGQRDQGYAITRALALGHEVLTDVVEVQLPGLKTDGAAWALGAALRESLASWLGLEPRELGISVAGRDGQLGRKAPSAYLFDEASGGAGYASTAHLRQLMSAGPVECRKTDLDGYGRVVARGKAGNTDLSCAQISGGFAIRRYAAIWCRN